MSRSSRGRWRRTIPKRISPDTTTFEKPWLDALQPLRTDCEQALSGAGFVDVEIEG